VLGFGLGRDEPASIGGDEDLLRRGDGVGLADNLTPARALGVSFLACLAVNVRRIVNSGAKKRKKNNDDAPDAGVPRSVRDP
jgi:hypothetical protein